ncbi:MAG: hypothetical protein ACT4NX_04460 [Deltaproteobacteria bacterium]
MEIQSAVQIARREWENIQISLQLCGDTGEFSLKRQVNGNLYLTNSLMDMERKIPVHDYLTLEAAYVFAELASKAAERLGLSRNLAKTFGSGYSWVRTGWVDLRWLNAAGKLRIKDHVVNQVLFFRLFFPSTEGDFIWGFDSPPVKARLKLIFDKFNMWQCNPDSRIEDFISYKHTLAPLWLGLTMTMDAPVGWC